MSSLKLETTITETVRLGGRFNANDNKVVAFEYQTTTSRIPTKHVYLSVSGQSHTESVYLPLDALDELADWCAQLKTYLERADDDITF